jgi:SAM-dependent methyltransferase
MSAFTADWLALREPADHAARSVRLTSAIAAELRKKTPLLVLDLAAGTGSNMRYLTAQLAGDQQWLLVDHDPLLLAQVSSRDRADQAEHRFETRQLDLAALADNRDPDIFEGRALVTAAALLDLVSESWLRELASRCRGRGAAVLFVLSYDGRIQCSPSDPDDDGIRDLVNRHQRTDKGFGPALGPDAADAAERCLTSLGYDVQRESSDWVLSPGSERLQRHVVEGWAEAAMAIAPDRSASIRGWLARRLAHVAGRRSQLVVGHQDLAAWIPSPINELDDRRRTR